MGLLVGLIPLPIPGVGRITLGLAGVLLVALVLGHIRRTGIVWTLPLSANMVLRNFGLTVFLAQVGIASGPQFAATVAESGFTLLLLGAIIMLVLIVVTMIAGRLLAIPADDLFGIVSGVTGNPAILVYANRAVSTERPDIGYAMVFPTMTVAKNSVRSNRCSNPRAADSHSTKASSVGASKRAGGCAPRGGRSGGAQPLARAFVRHHR